MVRGDSYNQKLDGEDAENAILVGTGGRLDFAEAGNSTPNIILRVTKNASVPLWRDTDSWDLAENNDRSSQCGV